MTPDLQLAQTFLTLLDNAAEFFCFQTFDDNKQRKDQSLARVFNGSLDEHWSTLVKLNLQGAGIFVTVNATDGEGRKRENIVRLRAIFQEADRNNTPLPPLEPHIEVESSPGKHHRYWLIDESTAPTTTDWQSSQNRMVSDFGSDPNAKDVSRVLRLPGFHHLKNPDQPHLVRITGQSKAKPYDWATIVEAVPPLVTVRLPFDASTIKPHSGKGIDSPLKIRSALAAIDPDCDYDRWLKVGMALHHATDGGAEGFALFDEWSALGSRYREGETAYKWSSFEDYEGKRVTLGTLFLLAKEEGWDWADEQFDYLEEARQTVRKTLDALPDDAKACLQPDALEALSIIQSNDPAEYESLRQDIKITNSSVRVGPLDELVARFNPVDGDDSYAKRLTKEVQKDCELWHDEDGRTFASFQREAPDNKQHRENWQLDSKGYRERLAYIGHTKLRIAPSSELIKTCMNTLAGIAKFEGPKHDAHRRVAHTQAGYWLDIGDDAWRAIHITATGWRIDAAPPIRFIRSDATRPLPIPDHGGQLDSLWSLVNIPEEERPLVLAWILESYRANTPYPVLELIGEQGSAKSTTQETLRTFIDPNKVMLRGRPKSVEDIYVAAGTNHLISLENLSGITPEMSDALCTVATGGGHAGRQFYTNGEEHLIEAHNPIALNGIGAVITRPDLLDRAIAICLPVIQDRMREEEHTKALEQAKSSIMGGLLDLFVATLAQLPKVEIPANKLPRMADFAYLGEAMMQVQGAEPGRFIDIYTGHRRDAIRRTIDTSPVGAAIIEFIEDRQESHAGTVKQLLARLDLLRLGHERNEYWPRSPRGLGDALRRLAPALRQIDIQCHVDSKPKRDGVHCELRSAGDHSKMPSHSQTPSQRSQRSRTQVQR